MRDGYIYAAAGNELLARVKAGDRVGMERLGRPWPAAGYVVASSWPGRLLRVRVVEPGGEQSAVVQANADTGGSSPFFPALQMDVLEELSPGLMFGPHGDATLPVIDRAWQLDERTARALVAAEHPRAGDSYQAVWNRWLKRYTEAPPAPAGRKGSTAIPGNPGSPVGYCPMLISAGVGQSARRAWGEAAGYLERHEKVLANPWIDAVAPLLHAAFALGAPNEVEEHDVLLQAWRSIQTNDDEPASRSRP